VKGDASDVEGGSLACAACEKRFGGQGELDRVSLVVSCMMDADVFVAPMLASEGTHDGGWRAGGEGEVG
jgi:hypothetical protein